METHVRSIVKGISWRIIATLVTAGWTYVFTGSVSIAVLVGSSEALSKIFLYWAHERIWHPVQWGRVIPTVSSP
jgi:adenylylsulfate kinase